MEKHSGIYTEPRTFGKYDANNIIGYLGEEIIPNHVPENNGEEEAEPVTGYKYTGTEKDGGTIMPCSDPTSYPEVANAIIRSKYTESDEMAIHRHFNNDPVADKEEWDEYNDFCEAAKVLAKRWLGIE